EDGLGGGPRIAAGDHHRLRRLSLAGKRAVAGAFGRISSCHEVAIPGEKTRWKRGHGSRINTKRRCRKTLSPSARQFTFAGRSLERSKQAERRCLVILAPSARRGLSPLAEAQTPA